MVHSELVLLGGGTGWSRGGGGDVAPGSDG